MRKRDSHRDRRKHGGNSMTIQPEFVTVRTNGIRLRVALAGKGPLVVLVHGWPESWYSWRHQSRPLLKRVIASPRLMSVAMAAATSRPRSRPMRSSRYAPTSRGSSKVSANGRQYSSATIGGAHRLEHFAVFSPKGSGGRRTQRANTGRGPALRIELFKNIYKDRFFYQLYLRNKVSRRPNSRPTCAPPYGKSTIRLRAKAGRRCQTGQAGRRKIPRRSGGPKSTAGLAHSRRPRLLRRGIRAAWFSRAAQPLSHLRTRLRPACEDCGPQDRTTGGLYRRQP